MPTIYTIGHSNISGEAFWANLVQHDIETLVDVRTSPSSRWPQFTGPALRSAAAREDIGYQQRGKNLGGKGRNVDFDESIAEMVRRADEGEVIALMCSEGDYRQCHRFTMLTPALVAEGATVIHIAVPGKGNDVTQSADALPGRKLPKAPETQQMFQFDLPTEVRGRAPKWVRP